MRALGLIAVVAVALLACAKKEKAASTLTASPKSASGRNYKVTVENVKHCDFGKDHFNQIGPGNVALGIEITVEGMAEGVRLAHSEFRIGDPEGHVYKLVTVGGCDPKLGTFAEVGRDSRVRGWVTFAVPEKASGLTFSLRPMLMNPQSPQAMLDDAVKFELR
jgi:hypothetical protein